MKSLCVVLVNLLLTFTMCYAQSPVFSQFYANPLHLNPAMAGTANEYRAVLVHRRQWAQPISSNTTAFSLDANLGPYSGWGIQILTDSQFGGILKTTTISGSLVHNIPLSKNSFLGVGIKFGVYQKMLDWESLVFEDQLDDRLGVTGNTNERFGRDRIINGDLGAGILFSSSKFFIGTSANHVNQPREEFAISSTSKLPIRYVVHAGGFFNFRNDKHHEITLSPNIIYERVQNFDYINAGISIGTKDWTAGAMYRFDEAFILSAGTNGKNFKLGYSFDIPISTFASVTGNSHELTVTYLFKPSKNQKFGKQYKGKCPSFYKRLF